MAYLGLLVKFAICVPKRNMAYLGCDGNDVFQGDHSGVITQVRGQNNPLPPWCTLYGTLDEFSIRCMYIKVAHFLNKQKTIL